MRRVLRVLFVFLMAATFCVGTNATVTASGGVGRSVQFPSVESRPSHFAAHHSPATAQLAQHPGSRHDGKCFNPCCVCAVSAATIAADVSCCVTLKLGRAAFPIPNDDVPAGIAVAPWIGPPKLLA